MCDDQNIFIMHGKNSINSRVAINHHKAGMQGIDKEKINKIILDNTIGSRFYKNEQKRNHQVEERIEKMKMKLNSFSIGEQQSALQKADQIINDIESKRNLSRTIIHIDMDAFYASVEERDKPELKTKPMAVGGMDMLSTSNYIARKFGVRAAMPGFIAMKLCPELIIVPLNFVKYKSVSKEIGKIYEDYDCNYIAASLDEAYLDITEHLQQRVLMSELERTYNYNSELLDDLNQNDSQHFCQSKTFGFSAKDVAEEIRFRIHQTTKLTASAGIAPNFMLAKIGSDLNKPNGQTLIPFSKEEIIDFMKDLPLRKVGGIGKVTEQMLTALGILTCGELIKKRAILVYLFSSVSASFFLQAGLGCSSNRNFADAVRKSISVERTFNANSDENELFLKLEELSQALSKDLQKHETEGKTVTLKIKTIDFEVHTRSKTSTLFLSKADDIYDNVKDLLKQEIMQSSKLSLRLLGISLSKLQPLTQNKQRTIEKFFFKQEENQVLENNIENCQNAFDKGNIPAKLPINLINLSTLPDEERTDYDACRIAEATCSDTGSCQRKALQNSPTLKCPICSHSNFDDLIQLNNHLDKCLIEGLCNQSNTNKKKLDTGMSPMTEASNIASDFACPICLVVFDACKTDLLNFNSHLDSCLNRQTIKSILKAEATSSRNANNIEKPKPVKRRKVISKQLKTIDQFFS